MTDALRNHRVVSHADWLQARERFLVKEKEFTRMRDELSRARRELPWEKVEKSYTFEGPSGRESLTDLFEGRSQLVVYHFMFAPDWVDGCKHCSFWADNFNGLPVHLNHRDTTFVAISHAPYASIAAFKKRMGWSFKWLSALDSDFNYDLYVSFKPEDLENGKAYYNYRHESPGFTEREGTSVFYKDEKGNVFHTYSCYARGIDMMNTVYHYLDLTPKGRDEEGLPGPQAWVRHHDKY